MFGFIKKIFIRLFSIMINGSNRAKSISLSYQKCTTQPNLINLYLMNTFKDYVTIHLQLT